LLIPYPLKPCIRPVLTHESAECEYVRREEEAEKYFVAK
jgi:hypothetical protein